MKNTSQLMLVLAVLSTGLMTSNAFAAVKTFMPFMPENARFLLNGPKSSVTEAQFDKVVADTTGHYQAIAALHGAKLVVDPQWADDTVNAQADQDGTTWNVHFWGGLARQSAMTVDGMTLVVCHELGHHFGGFPFFSDPGSAWGAVEGQADYFATEACAKVVWENDTAGNTQARSKVTPFIQSKCDAAYGATNDQNICYRTTTAALALAAVLADGTGTMPAVETPDVSTVAQTNEDHPEAQCRLDTYFHAALCPVAFDVGTIPGKNNPSGQASLDAQKEAFKYSCSTTQNPQGARPACWFKEI